MLQDALNGIGVLDLPSEFSGVIIVDNDPDGSASKIIKSFKKSFQYPVYYFIESKKGIAYARQRVLDEANTLGFNTLAFFDDDAVPDHNWLINLYSFYIKNHCIVATGPQMQVLEKDALSWVKKGGFFTRQKPRKEGKSLKGAATNNVIFSLDFVREHKLSFDLRFNSIGGEDTDFFWQFYRLGAKILWTNTAIVREVVPNSRANFKWLFNRSVAIGTRKYIHITKEKKMSFFILSIQIFFKFFFGFIAIILSLPLGRIIFYRMLFKWARSVGMLIALFGYQYQEYSKKTHGA
jgi:GT2 family glycosyltransferase